MNDFTDKVLHETRLEGAPLIAAVVASAIAAAPLDYDGALLIVWKGNELSAYAFGDDDPLKVYGALSMVQKQGLVTR